MVNPCCKCGVINNCFHGLTQAIWCVRLAYFEIAYLMLVLILCISQQYQIIFCVGCQYPTCWTKDQWTKFTADNTWLFAFDGKLGCSTCHAVQSLGPNRVSPLRACECNCRKSGPPAAFSRMVTPKSNVFEHFARRFTSTAIAQVTRVLKLYLLRQRPKE